MNNEQLKTKVIQGAESILLQKVFIAPIDLLMEIGVLPKQKYEAWRSGKVDYLEAVCTANLSKLTLIMKELRTFAAKKDLRASFTVYNRWGAGKKTRLRFSKSGNENIEKIYATHYVKRAINQELNDNTQGNT